MGTDLVHAWDRASSRYADLDVNAARFNAELLRTLRPRWQASVRPDTSMFNLLFIRPETTGYTADEWVEVLLEVTEDRVRVAF